MATTAAAADRPIMPFVKTGHGVSRLSDARNSRASLRELATREKKYRATRGVSSASAAFQINILNRRSAIFRHPQTDFLKPFIYPKVYKRGF